MSNRGALLAVAALGLLAARAAHAKSTPPPAAAQPAPEQIFGFMDASITTMTPTRLSETGLAMLKQHEGWRAHAYRDTAGKWTIGYGHLIKPGESFPGEITRAQGEALLRADVRTAERAVLRLVRVPLTQAQFDALVSFTYNVGADEDRDGIAEGLGDSTLLRKLNAGDYAGAAAEFDKWRLSGGRVTPGLVSRRAAEKSLFLAGTPGAGVTV